MENRPFVSSRVLVVEGDSSLSAVLCDALRARGHMARAATSAADARELAVHPDFDAVLLDLEPRGPGGLDLLRQLVKDGAEPIVLVGPQSIASGLQAMALGAYGFVVKPPRLEEIEAVIVKATEKTRVLRENALLRARLEQQEIPTLIAEDPAMKAVAAALDRAASSDIPVVVQGEAGTGKRHLARVLHARSRRASFPFVAVTAGTEIFGPEKPGPLARARGGVLLLTQVSELSPPLQAKLLRLLEGGTETRVVSAARKSLRAEVQAGRFREALYHRLNGVTLRLPPLRERKADIAPLAAHFLGRRGGGKAISPAAADALRTYPWPGNVRELEIVIERAALVAESETIEAEDLRLGRGARSERAPHRTDLTLEAMEREYIRAVLRESGGHRGRAARALGIDPKTLYNRLGPERPRRRPRSA